MAWTDLTFTFGQVLTSTQMTQLDDNFEAMANGDPGAPEIKRVALQQVCQVVSAEDSAGQSTTGSYVDYITQSITTSGGKVIVLFEGVYSCSDSRDLQTRLYRDAVAIGIENDQNIGITGASHTVTPNASVTNSVVDSPSAGTYTYRIKIKDSSTLSSSMGSGTLILMEVN